jgi:hypothetical protein
MLYPVSWTPLRIIPHLPSDVTVLNITTAPALLSGSISVSAGTITFSLVAPGTYLVYTDDGTYQEVAQFSTDPSGALNVLHSQGWGRKSYISVGSLVTQAAWVTAASVSPSGHLLLSRSDGSVLDAGYIVGPGGTPGATGPAGPQGATGAQGPAATVAVGTTTTGPAGTSASVTNSGTSGAAVLNFTVPAGATGSQGPAGPTGPQGPAGRNPVTVSTTAPSSPADGDIWFNIS